MKLETPQETPAGELSGQQAEAESTAQNPMHAAEALARRLLGLRARDARLSHEAVALPESTSRLTALAKARVENGQALKAIVQEGGWPSREAVGDEASTAALQLLLHAEDRQLQLACRDLILASVQEGDSPAIHGAYIEDFCCVLEGRKQWYGTKFDPTLLRPFPIEDPDGVDERRREVGLPPLEDQLRQLRGTAQHRT
ncbi:DUF6624 domain-containing protein [Streptomyces sp. NPDC058471]|uniref:DUF6624 domain-containing protein n=1 Tax=Streptomyces sp. NPDC058471 TaxID=3346516 RepID=UPI003651240C